MAKREVSLPDDLLLRPAEEAVRRIARRHLARAAEARRHLGDDDRLRAFRVSLRRLRVTLRAYAPYLNKDVAKLRRRLGEVQAGTGAGRDAEAVAARLQALLAGLTPASRRAAAPLSKRLLAERRRAYRRGVP